MSRVIQLKEIWLCIYIWYMIYGWSSESVKSITFTSTHNCQLSMSVPFLSNNGLHTKHLPPQKHNLAKTRWLYQQCAALIWVLCYRNKQCARIQEMPKSPNKWKKPAGCSISTISLPSVLKLILTGVVLRSQELLHAFKKEKKKEKKLFKELVDKPHRAVERFRGKKMIYFYKPVRKRE